VNTKNQKGFSLIEGLLLVIAVGLVVFVGYYVWHSQKQTDKTLNTAAKTSDAASNAAKTSTTQSTKYLTLKELGVKIPLSTKIQDAKYEMAPDGETADISTTSFENAVAECKAADTASASFPTIVTLNKVDGTYDANNPPFDAYSTFAAQLSGFYLMSGGSDGGYCNGTNQAKNQAVKDKFVEFSSLLKDAVKNAKQTN
jgi:type II secretory pathway pseudopilin PulG